MADRTAVVVSCEHATNRVPVAFAPLFRGRERLLASHRGWDPGSLELARALARRFRAPLVAARATRLIVETNRSEGHPRLFSEVTRGLPRGERARIVKRWWRPHRALVVAAIEQRLAGSERVLHVAAHSFAAVLDGERRRADVALLYDPARRPEWDLCRRWRHALMARDPGLAVRRNYPYRGNTDGLTTALRRRFAARAYLGIELEVNQRWPSGDPRAWRRLRTLVVESLVDALT